jgi:hypothetical protein
VSSEPQPRTDAEEAILLPGPLFLGAFLVMGLPAVWAAGLDSCSEAAWWAPLLASTGLAAGAFYAVGHRRGHPWLGVVGALVGGCVWFLLAVFVTFLVWLPFVPDRCEVTIWSA